MHRNHRLTACCASCGVGLPSQNASPVSFGFFLKLLMGRVRKQQTQQTSRTTLVSFAVWGSLRSAPHRFLADLVISNTLRDRRSLLFHQPRTLFTPAPSRHQRSARSPLQRLPRHCCPAV